MFGNAILRALNDASIRFRLISTMAVMIATTVILGGVGLYHQRKVDAYLDGMQQQAVMAQHLADRILVRTGDVRTQLALGLGRGSSAAPVRDRLDRSAAEALDEAIG